MKPIYNILSLEPTDNGHIAQVCFDPDHIIYSAHFPNNPITPGVILLQICKQCAKHILHIPPEQTDIIIQDIKMLKFTDFIIPKTNQTISILLNHTDNTFKCEIFDESHQYAKMQFTLSA